MKTKGENFSIFATGALGTISRGDGKEGRKNTEERRTTTRRGTPATDVGEGAIANIGHYNMGVNSVY
jgi:hypothetical protein